jgi:phosphoribosylaminoimidazolecarboxamide formyltransferase/IMP cyclohydrolase
MTQIKKRALISVSNKNKLDQLVHSLIEHDYEIISTGGTKKYINELGYDVTPVSKITGDEEILGGRVKTLSYKLYASLLYDKENQNHIDEIKKLSLSPIDLVVCNLYPFEDVSKKTDNLEDLIETIDIGGPTMLRAAAKNYKNICTLTDPSDYSLFINHLNTSKIDDDFRLQQAVKVFNRLSEYNQAIAFKLDQQAIASSTYIPLRYGENAHQKAWIKKNQHFHDMQQLHGKDLSYNNMLDVEAAYLACFEASLSAESKMCSVSVVKHNNPCGLALSPHKTIALENAWNGDSKSSFGSIICTNSEITLEMAHFLMENS